MANRPLRQDVFVRRAGVYNGERDAVLSARSCWRCFARPTSSNGNLRSRPVADLDRSFRQL